MFPSRWEDMANTLIWQQLVPSRWEDMANTFIWKQLVPKPWLQKLIISEESTCSLCLFAFIWLLLLSMDVLVFWHVTNFRVQGSAEFVISSILDSIIPDNTNFFWLSLNILQYLRVVSKSRFCRSECEFFGQGKTSRWLCWWGKLVPTLSNELKDETEQLSKTILFPGSPLHPGCFFVVVVVI